MRSRRLLVTMAALATACATLLAPVTAAHAEMPDAPTGALVEALAEHVGQDECSPSAKPGVAAFQRLLMARYPGSRNLGIVRQCHLGSRSEHKEGRAFDWGVRVDRPTEKAYADDVIRWLLATDPDGARYANARRVGIMYMIWNRKIWSATRPADGWRAYTGPSPHTDHIHFSFTWPAAYKLTSYWTGTTYGRGSQGGKPDATYANAGQTAYSTANRTRLVTQLPRPDGRRVSVGQSAGGLVIGDVNADGTPRASFAGGRSRVVLPLPAGTTLAGAALAPDGALVVTGSVPMVRPAPEPDPDNPTDPADPAGTDPVQPAEPQQDMLLARVLPDGTLDGAFGTGGIATYDSGGEDTAAAVAVTAAGDAVVAGTTVVPAPVVADTPPAAPVSRVTVAKFARTGLLVPTFGTAGVANLTARGVLTGTAVLPQADGKTVIGCATAAAACLVRLSATGLPDTTFGVGGVAVHTTMTRVTALVAGPGTLLLAAGPAGTGNPTVLRLLASGGRDTMFGRSGVATVAVPGCTGRPAGLTLRSDGSVLLSSLTTGCAYSASVARFMVDGSLDARWGADGVAAVRARSSDVIRSASAPILQTDGRVVLPVTAGAGDAFDMTSMRFTTLGPVPSRLAVVRSTAKVVHGSPVTVYGVVRSTADNRRAPGVPVTLYAKKTGAASWTAVAKATTSSTGVATFKQYPTVGTAYYTKSSATIRVHAATSGTTAVAVAPSLTTPVASATVPAGTPFDLKVVVKTPHAGSRIQLQRYRLGRWELLSTRTLDTAGVARFRLLSVNSLVRPYRWVLPAHSDHAVGVSRTVTVTWAARTGR